jgi:uncharacterized phage protein (TIGR01671 family)
MREIKFCGRDVNGRWWIGSLVQSKPRKGVPQCWIKEFDFIGLGALSTPTRVFHEVDPKTVGQFTGLRDKNGKEIYEGDRIAHDDDFKHAGAVQFSRGVFGINWDYDKNTDPEWQDGRLYGGWGDLHNLRKMSDDFNREMVVIGNIHDSTVGASVSDLFQSMV